MILDFVDLHETQFSAYAVRCFASHRPDRDGDESCQPAHDVKLLVYLDCIHLDRCPHTSSEMAINFSSYMVAAENAEGDCAHLSQSMNLSRTWQQSLLVLGTIPPLRSFFSKSTKACLAATRLARQNVLLQKLQR